MNLHPVAKVFFLISLVSFLLGSLWQFTGGNIPLGKLPGDIHFKNGNSSFYFPLTTCLVISALVSFLSYLYRNIK